MTADEKVCDCVPSGKDSPADLLVKNPSFVLKAVKDVVFEDRPVPKLRSPKDVRVHIAQTGICGSDVRG